MDTIDYSNFLFSDEKKYRIRRHLLFWIFWGIYFSLMRLINTGVFKGNGDLPNLFNPMASAFLILLSQAVLVYPLLYFILPRYLFNGKYIKALFFFIALLSVTLFINAVFLVTIPWHETMWMRSKNGLLSGETSMARKLSFAFLASLQGALASAALAASLKMFKYYYVKNIRNQQLMKENIEAQLRLLQAQVHPHFLFNTLNNIFSQTQTESPKGSKMIMGLSDMLRYILYEGQKSLVPLKQELQMVSEYIKLEKIRYGNKLDVHVHLPERADDIYIAPLLLLPFVENCFKHDTGKILQNPWINLIVELKDTNLIMKLMNGKESGEPIGNSQPGIGINNVRQRLDLLYRGKYDLQINEDEEVFVVDLKVELIKQKDQELINSESSSKTDIAYA